MTATTGTAVGSADTAPEEARLSSAARRLLEAANDLFHEQGALATSVREITAACGLTPGALYNHFTSKEELLFVLVRGKHLMIEREVKSAQASAGGDPVSQLSAIVGVYLRVNVTNSSGARVANREYVHLTGRRLAEIVAIRRRLRDRVTGVLLDGQSQGVFDLPGGSDTASARLVASTLLDMCIYSSAWLRAEGPLSLDELERRFATMALRLAGSRQPA